MRQVLTYKWGESSWSNVKWFGCFIGYSKSSVHLQWFVRYGAANPEKLEKWLRLHQQRKLGENQLWHVNWNECIATRCLSHLVIGMYLKPNYHGSFVTHSEWMLGCDETTNINFTASIQVAFILKKVTVSLFKQTENRLFLHMCGLSLHRLSVPLYILVSVIHKSEKIIVK